MKTVSVICGFVLCLFNVIAAQRLYDSECEGSMDIRYIGDELAKLEKLFVEEMAKLRVDILRVKQNSPQSCPPQWVPYRNSCYFFGNDYGNWNQGKVKCEQKHGSSKYVRITSQEEDTFLRNFVRSKGITGDTSKQYTEEEMTTLKKTCVAEMAKLSQSTNYPQSCPPQWVPYRNFCYFFGNDYGNWNQGKVRCEQKHGSSKYVRITSQEEDTFLRNFVRSKGITDKASRDYWIGGTDASLDGVFMWEGYSQRFTYTNWGPNNPDRVGTPDCVILYQPSDYKWHDTSCSNNNSYICEIEL